MPQLRSMRGIVWVLGGCLTVGPAAIVLGQPPAPKTIATFNHGWIAYTQGGKTDSLPLDPGNRMDEPQPPIGRPGERSVDMMFSKQGGATFELGIDKVGSGLATITIKVNAGPAGDSMGPDLGQPPCQSKFTKFDATGITGTFTCTGKFTTGSPVTAARLAVSP